MIVLYWPNIGILAKVNMMEKKKAFSVHHFNSNYTSAFEQIADTERNCAKRAISEMMTLNSSKLHITLY